MTRDFCPYTNGRGKVRRSVHPPALQESRECSAVWDYAGSGANVFEARINGRRRQVAGIAEKSGAGNNKFYAFSIGGR
jgi:hypothetical protein